MRTAVYLRKSRTEEQNEPVEATLKRHYEQLMEFAGQNGLQVLEIYEEVVSGETLYGRPQMLRLMADVQEGLYDAVLCMDIDRLGRGSMSDQGVILETFKRAGVRIITPRKSYDLSDELDETYTEFETFIARQELKQIKRRLTRGLQKTIRDGGYVANAPYGYRKILRQRIPSLEIIEEEASFVRMIFDLYVNQGAGTELIARTVTALGAKPRRSDAFCRTSIQKILRNPVYIGKIVWNQTKHIRKNAAGVPVHQKLYNPPGEWILSEGLHPPIISEALFSRAQELMSGRRHPPYFTGEVENQLAGLIKCANCGASLQRRLLGRKGVPYLVCPHPGCMTASRQAYVEEALLSCLREPFASILLEPSPAPEESARAQLLRAIHRETDALSRQKRRLHELLEQGVYDPDTFKSRLDALKSREALLLRQEQAASISTAAPDRTARTVYDAYLAASPKIKNRILKAAVREITYQKEKGAKPRTFTLSVDLKYSKI